MVKSVKNILAALGCVSLFLVVPACWKKKDKNGNQKMQSEKSKKPKKEASKPDKSKKTKMMSNETMMD